MSNLPARIKYVVMFKSVRTGNEWNQPEPLEITEMQYNAIKEFLNNSRFIEINGSSYNSSEIRMIEKVIDEPPAINTYEEMVLSPEQLARNRERLAEIRETLINKAAI